MKNVNLLTKTMVNGVREAQQTQCFGASTPDVASKTARQWPDNGSTTARVWRYVAMLLMVLTLGVGQMWGTYYYRGNQNSWSETAMTASEDGNYEYFSAKGYSNNGNKNNNFKVSLGGDTWTYNNGYCTRGYNKTNISGTSGDGSIGLDWDGDNICVYNTADFYILVYKPKTTINATNNPVICCATYLPDNRSCPVYFVNSSSWTGTIYAYGWFYDGTNGRNANWPGASMTNTSKTYNDKTIYSYTFTNSYPTAIFNNNSSQTSDITMGYSANGKMYDGSNWVTLAYDVTLDKQSGSDGTSTIIATPGSAKPSIASLPTRTGYNFGGYYTETSGGGTQYYNASGTATSGNWPDFASGPTTLYAKWTEKTYSLTFANDGHGTVKVAGTTISSGSTASVNHITTKTLVATANTGYNFSNWSLSGSNTSNVTIGSTTTASTTIKATATGATVTANFTPKTYTITLDKNGADGSDGSATATYNSNSLTSVSHPTYTDYRCDGYYTDASSGTKIINSNGTLVASTSYTDASGNWTYNGNLKLYAHWTYDVTNYTVTYGVGTSYTSYGSISAYNNTTSAALGASPQSVRSGQSVTFTASPNTGYTVEGWYTDAACSSGKHDAGSSTYTTTIGEATAVYVKFVEKTWTVTFAAGTGGSVTTPNSSPQTVGQLTGISIAATPSSGYNFSSWSSSSGGSFVSGASTNSNTFKPTANTTVTASFSEIPRTITISGGTASSTTAGVVAQGTATAATPATGKKFTGWTLGDGVSLAGGYALTDKTIKFTASKNSTVTANFADRASVKMYFAKPTTLSWGTLYAYAWQSDNTSNKNATYPGVELSTTETINHVVYYVYQYYTEGDGIGGSATGQSTWDKVIFGCNDDSKKTGDLTISNGHYYFKSSTGTGKDAAITSAWCIKGAWNSWSEDADQITHSTAAAGSKAITLTTGAKEFKIYNIVNETWWRFPGNVTATKSATAMDNSDGNMTITPTIANSYTFALGSLTSTPTLAITYPTTYTVTYSVSPSGAANAITTSPSVSSGGAILSGTSVTFTHAAAKTGYTWYRWENGSGSSLGTDDTYTTTIGANTTVKAVYTENSHNATVSAGTGGSVSPNGTVAIKQATGTSLTATALAGYKFSSWTISGGGITPTSSSTSPQTFKATTTGGTIQANFARTYAFIEGRFHITNADRDGTWTNTFAEGNWDESSIQIPFAYDNTNHLFYLRTYATPKELSTNISDLQPYFFIKLGSSSSSVSDAVTYRPYTSGTTYQELSAAGDGNKKQAITPGNSSHSYWFNSTDESGYVKLYFNQSHIWYWLEQTLEYDANGGTGDAPAKTYHDKGTNATAASNTFTRDGYTFSGWKTAPSSGTSYSAGASVTMNSNITLYAQWAANDYTITLDQQTSATGYSASGTASVPTVTYNAVLPAISGTMPTTTGYYGFMGFYTEENGEGERLTDGTGAWIASVDGYTDADKKWIYPGNVTLYAYYRTATIGSISLGGETAFAQNTSVTATATIEPTPVSTTVVCWRLLHYNDNPVDPQPTFTPASGTSVSFNTPEASGMYKIEATLRTGSTCGSGDELGSNTQSFQVAGEHTVTIQYMCGDVTLKEPVSMTGRPLSWSDEITAPEIFGYTFTRWTAGDGVTITDDDGETTKTTTTEEAIKLKATYDARLTAEYTQKSLIFFKNTLNWGSVYVNFYTGSYWSNPKGSGNENVTNRNKEMTQIGETDVWYFDYGEEDITPSSYVSFTDAVQDNYKEFWGGSPGVNVVYPANYADDIHTDKSSETGFKPATPMFVPLASQEPVTLNEGGGGWANYYNSGYWTQYTAGTGYTLEVYNSEGNVLQKSMTFTSADDLMPMSATVDLEGGITYKFQIRRGGTGDNGVYYGNGGEMTYTNHGQDVAWDLSNSSFSMCRLTTNASGDYTFNLSYSSYHDDGTGKDYYRLRIAVDYPVATGDYRLVYTDSKPTCKPSAIVPLVNNGKDTVSFFVRKDSSPSLRIQKATVANDGTITWAEYPTAGTPTNQITSSIASAITKDSVYNFCLEMNGSGALSVAKAEPYTGSYYIRVDCANSKWDNYRSDRDHLMTYSEYSDKKAGYSHYYTHWVDCSESGRKNVKFCIANDYSPCISDTLTREANTGTWANINNYITEGGDLQRNANVRFMWNRHDNSVSRAYVDGAQEDGSHFLQILSADSKIKNAAGDAVLTEVTFSDKGNWLYEAMIKAQPNAQIKLKSIWGTTNTIEQYFKGSSDAPATLIGGTSSDWYDIRLIYDFKTNRLVTAYLPSGTLSEDLEIHADIMFLREHQGDVTQIDFTGGAKITDIETVYSVLQFNMWTLNNRSKSSGHALLSPLLSRYERDLFYVSFPYDVKLSDVIGFGTYGKHWIIEYYDGAERAEKGFWADSPSFWKFVTPAMKNSFTLKAGTGYIVALDLDELWWKANDDKSDVWKNTEVAELLFPGNVASISSTTVTYNMPEHTCTIGPRFDGGEDRTIKDSHWNILGVPTYHNLTDAGVVAANTTWTTAHTNYIYTWNMQDNTLTATAATDFEYQAMHAYMVQYAGNVTFTTSSSPVPAGISRRANSEEAQEVEFRIELQQDNNAADQTFLRMSNDEEVSAGFVFGEDMSKEFNKNKANIYTFIADVQAAGNTLPMSEQTTIVPVGVKTAANDDYTFSIPEGTSGIGVTLIDTETGIRTNLSAVDYTVSLEQGTYDDRFLLEISPIRNVPTEIETPDIRDQKSDVRKILIDDLLYIVRDGKVYDARGARVE